MTGAPAVVSMLPPKAAKLLAVEILLSAPESLGDVQSCLYILRDKLRSA